MIQFYNSLTRKKEEFKPLKKGKAGLYTCGPTVYNYVHIGNLRTYIFEDVLRRVLEAHKLKVRHVMNITDVGHLTSDADEGEDKLEKSAKTIDDVRALVQKYTNAFFDDAKKLNILRPHFVAPASGHVPDQIKLVQALLKKSVAYEAKEALYFDTSKFPQYASLFGRNVAAQRVGVREEVAVDPDKRNPQDFALWFKRVGRFKNHIQYWKSPWGDGFPGWHIECSAISVKFLGQPFDIHAGAVDLAGTHHPNEIAQSESALGKPLANMWLHGEFLNLKGAKMAKSGENFITIRELEKRGYDPLSFRYYVLNAKYRTPLEFSWEALDAAQNIYKKIVSATANMKSASETGRKKKSPEAEALKAKFYAYLFDDLNTPSALSVFWLVFTSQTLSPYEKYALFLEFDSVLGLGLSSVKAEKPVKIPPAVAKLLSEREGYRKLKDWKRADEIRLAIEKMGWIVKDTPLGQEVSKRA